MSQSFLVLLLWGWVRVVRALWHYVKAMPVFMPYIKRSPATSAFVGVTCGSKSSVLWGLAKGAFFSGVQANRVLPSEGLLELGDAVPDVVLHDPRTNSNITLTNILGEHGNMPIVLNFGSIT